MCDAESAHPPGKCRRKPKWFIGFHQVDRCQDVPDREISVCKACFDAHVFLAKRTIAAGMEEVRATICLGCNQPLVRLSSILKEVGWP